MRNTHIGKLLVCILSVTVVLSSISVSALSFTHRDNIDGSSKTVLSYDTYIPTQSLSAADYGLDDSFKDISDIYISADNKIYLLCNNKSFIAVLNADYTLNRFFNVLDKDGNKIDLHGANGIYVENDKIYICDTDGTRIIITDLLGKYIDEMGCPESDLLPETFIFQPMRVVRDSDGFLYVLSAGCFYGLLTFSPENEFMGFYGANQVKSTILDTFSYLFELLTSNDAKKSVSEKKLPYSFVDMTIDNEGFVTACTGLTTAISNGQIRKLSPKGINIIKKRNIDGSSTGADSLNFLENSYVASWNWDTTRMQNLVSIECSYDGYIYALDQTYGIVYIYDNACNMLGSFGGGAGKGNRLGEFQKATAMAVNCDDVIIADGKTGLITVFRKTEYAKALFKAQSMYLRGDYDEAFPLWQEVISYDSGNQLAYRGLAMGYYNEGQYQKAKAYAKQGDDLFTYDLAHQKILKTAIANNFIYITIAVLLLIALSVWIILKRKDKEVTTNSKLKTVFRFSVHPFAASSDIKYKQMGSTLYASIALTAFFLAFALQITASGFLFRNQDADSYNVFYTIAQTFGMVVLWSVANWLVCTLFSGNGKISEIYICSSYSLAPLTLFTFIKIICSYFLPLSAAGLVNGLYIAVLIYTFFILAVSIMTIHDYSFPKFLVTGIVTVIGMILIVFIIFMVVILLQQFWNLLYSVYMEFTIGIG